MQGGERVRFCNNPVCERCDEHLRPWEVLRTGRREVCPTCHEALVVRAARPRPPLLAVPARAEPEPRRA